MDGHYGKSSDESVKLAFREGTLTLRGMAERGVRYLFPDVPWVSDSRTGEWRCDAIHYAHVIDRLPKLTVPFEDLVPSWTRIDYPHQRLFDLRDEQKEAIDAWMAHQGRGTLEMPTGTGKTEIALHAMSLQHTSTLIIAPVRDLMYQWHRRILDKFAIDAGIIGDRIFRVSPVSVTTYDSACIHMATLGHRFEMLVFDECHHLAGPLRRDAARMSAARYRLGLTATYARSDGAHTLLDDLIGPVVYQLPIEAVKGKSLSDYQVIRIPIQLAEQERERYDALSQQVRQYMHDQRQLDPHFTWEKVCDQTNSDPSARRVWKAYNEKRSIEDRASEKLRVVEDLLRLHAGEPVLIFAGSNAMARDVSLRFLIPCLLNHCGKRERLDLLQGLETGVYPALVANRVLDEGVDLPAVKVAIVIGGMASDRQAKQRLGRVLRKQGNQRAVLYEVVTESTGEVQRSRQRRKSDAYKRTRHRPL